MTTLPHSRSTPSKVAAEDFERIFNAAPGLFLVLTPDLKIVAVTDGYLHATMTRAEQIMGRDLFEVFPDNPDDPQASGVANLRASLDRVLTHHRADAMAVQKYDIARPAAAGGGFEERYWSPVNSPVFDDRGELIFIIHRVEDVTELVRARIVSEHQAERTRELEHKALRSQGDFEALNRLLQQSQADKQRYESLLDAIGGIVWEADLATPHQVRNTYVSPLALERTGYPRADWDATFWERHIHKEDADHLRRRGEARLDGGEVNLEFRILAADGKSLWMRDRVTAARANGHVILRGLVLDITTIKRADEQLLHAQKMESVGLLAGGIAHDFNNMLGVMMGTASLVSMKLAPDDPLHKRMEAIIDAGKRSADLTGRLLAFSRQQVLQPRVFDLNPVVAETDRMLRKLIPENIDIATDLAPDLGLVRADPGQFQQVLINLAVNARDAMPTGGRLLIATSNVRVDAPYVAVHPEMKVGEYVVVVVSDTGMGMDAATCARIFEPFFTTKGSQGTGLGLAMVYGIVRQSDGHIWVYSEPGQGTMFKVYFPRVHDAATPAQAQEAAMESRGTETVLVAEDQDLYRELICEILNDQGYEVISAANGEAALRKAAEHSGPIHVILTDVIMPTLSGFELVKAVRASRPETRVIFMSGYMDDAVSRHGVINAGDGFLQKPFGPTELLRQIRKVLE
jgi:two-component system, cell cycle sensor histidine kinase and response regulator CckA